MHFNQVNVPLLEILNCFFCCFFFIRDKSSMKMLIHKTNALLGMFPPRVKACTCLSFLLSAFFPAVLATCSKVTSCFFSVLISILHVFEWSHVLCCVWIVNKWKGSLRHCCSVLFLALHHHEFSQKTDSKSRNGEKEGRRGKKEGKGNVIELPWKISIT